MMTVRWLALLAALLCTAAMVCAEDSTELPDPTDNEVVGRGDLRADKLPTFTPPPVIKEAPVSFDSNKGVSTPSTTSEVPDSTGDKKASPSDSKGKPTSDDDDDDTPSTPPRPQGIIHRFLSDIMQIPIAVLKSVTSLLSSTFSPSGAKSNPTVQNQTDV